MIPHNRPTLGAAETSAAERVLTSGWVAQGREVEAFENEVCKTLGLDPGHAVALSSGSAALFLALHVLGTRGKRIAIPVYSCAAVRNAVVMAGGEPVPIDVAPDSPNIDLDHAAAAGVDSIVAAHIFGVPGALHAPVPIVEDCAQAFGARIAGRPVGVRGKVGVFSFYASKLLTSGGQGGMLVSPDEAVITAARDYREFDCRRDLRPRFNLQMTDLQAAIGRAQLQRLGEFLDRRRAIYERYAAAGLPLWPNTLPVGAEPCRYRAILRVGDPERAIAHFRDQGIRAIVPIADFELLGAPEDFPLAAGLARSTVSIPIFPSLTAAEVEQIIAAARGVPQ